MRFWTIFPFLWDFRNYKKLIKELWHVVGVLQFHFLLSCAGVWLSQHYYAIATVVVYKSHYGALLNVRTKGLREFKQGLVSYKEEYKKN